MTETMREILAAASLGVVPGHIRERARRLLEKSPPKRKGPKKSRSATEQHVAQRKKAADLAEAEALTNMRREVWARNLRMTSKPRAPHGICDCGCGYVFRHAEEGELDHWIARSQGGQHHPDNGWRLCSEHHRQKTDSIPSAIEWNHKRRRYCDLQWVPFVARRERP